jgi:hypothetical protein
MDARGRYVQRDGQGVGAHAQWSQVVFAQDFAGMHGPHSVDGKIHAASSVVVHDFDVSRPGGRPDKAHAPLPIDADTVLAAAIVFQRFELVARRWPILR